MIACHCLMGDLCERLASDASAPSIAVCAACCRLDLCPTVEVAETGHGSDHKRFGCLERLNVVPVSPGMTLFDLVCRTNDPSLTVALDPSHPAFKYLLLDGVMLHELAIVRNTVDGQVLILPTDNQPWHERVIHPDDVAVVFGTDLPEPPKGLRGVSQILGDQLMASGGVRFAPRRMFRLT